MAQKLGLALSLPTIKKVGGAWLPSDETGLEAWYKYQTGITLNGEKVEAWADSSSNSFNMLQATVSEQPAYNSGDIDFTAANTTNLQAASDITLSGAFTVGIKLEPDVQNVVVIGDNTDTNEFFKITTTTNVRFKTDGSSADMTIDSGTLITALNLVITRNASNLVTLYIDGVAQADTETLAGTAEINALGVRATDANPYDGTISEVQIYDTESTALTANVSTYLSNI